MRTELAVIAIAFCAVLQWGCGNQSVQAAAAVTGGDPGRGPAAIFHYGCGSCHTIKGIPNARGLVGPPLSGLRDRTFVAGMLTNTPDHLTHWIKAPKAVNPRTAMPQLGVSDRDALDIAAYLYSLN